MSSDERETRTADAAAQQTSAHEDTAMRCLTPEERAKLSIDSWEPSLLRHLLRAANRLPEPPGEVKPSRLPRVRR